jgi:hypothetical protein
MDDDSRRLEWSSSLRQLGHSDVDALFWLPERRGTTSSWWGHVPFAHWLMQAISPRVFVELGTHRGVSYSAFCHAVARCGLNTRCFAVDTWKGDEHVSSYDESVYEEFSSFHDERYGGFSTLLRGTFDDALEHIGDGSIDLLHIDGTHVYESVRHDFETWLPKMSCRGVVLFHDIDVHWDRFGVWRLWRELTPQYPHFDFHHCYGLGVLAVGREMPDAVAELCAIADTEHGAVLRQRVASIGERWVSEGRENEARVAAETLQSELSGAETRLRQKIDELERARAEAQRVVDERGVRIDELERARAEEERRIIDGRGSKIAELESALAEAQRVVDERGVRIDELERTRAEEERRIIDGRGSKIAELESALAEAQRVVDERGEKIQELEESLRSAEHGCAELARAVASVTVRLRAIETSAIWRASAQARAIAARLPQPVRRNLRRVAKLGYWALTPHKMPMRIKALRDGGGIRLLKLASSRR